MNAIVMDLQLRPDQEKGRPKRIGRYQLREMIAKGGMSKIYRGLDEIIGREVAIKLAWTLDPAWKNMRPENIINLFRVEVQISGQLSHHNFITIHDAGQEGDYGYLVMELLDGKSLMVVIEEDSISVRLKIEIIAQVARALHYAHQNGIIHRDIKPSNIMLLKNGQIKILDFGVSLISEGSSIKLVGGVRQLSGVGGTPYYMAPEQVAKKPIDARADLFALGVVGYELLTGQRPFTAKTASELYKKIAEYDPPDVNKLNSKVTPVVSDIIMKCLAKHPKDRHRDCALFADKLDEVLSENFQKNSEINITDDTRELIQKYRASFQFFFDLDNQEIYDLLQVCKIRKFAKGAHIVEEGEVARYIYLTLSGDIKIYRTSPSGERYTISILKRGDILGEMGIIDGGPRSASALALTDCNLLVLHQVALQRCADSVSAKIYKNLAAIISRKLRGSFEALNQLKES